MTAALMTFAASCLGMFRTIREVQIFLREARHG